MLNNCHQHSAGLSVPRKLRKKVGISCLRTGNQGISQDYDVAVQRLFHSSLEIVTDLKIELT
jgi:hypothetical protein